MLHFEHVGMLYWGNTPKGMGNNNRQRELLAITLSKDEYCTK